MVSTAPKPSRTRCGMNNYLNVWETSYFTEAGKISTGRSVTPFGLSARNCCRVTTGGNDSVAVCHKTRRPACPPETTLLGVVVTLHAAGTSWLARFKFRQIATKYRQHMIVFADVSGGSYQQVICGIVRESKPRPSPANFGEASLTTHACNWVDLLGSLFNCQGICGATLLELPVIVPSQTPSCSETAQATKSYRMRVQ